MQSDYSIRLSTLDDLPAILDISHELFLHDQDWIDGIVMGWSYSDDAKKLFTNYITQKEGVCYVAVTDENVIGYISGELKKPESWRNVKVSEISNIMILQGHRKQGVGKLLCKEFYAWSKSQGANQLMVEASAPNANAIEFYKSIGFEPYTLQLEQPIN
jgi:ribosomal protein S18 acetylase RimI-like enzyme